MNPYCAGMATVHVWAETFGHPIWEKQNPVKKFLVISRRCVTIFCSDLGRDIVNQKDHLGVTPVYFAAAAGEVEHRHTRIYRFQLTLFVTTHLRNKENLSVTVLNVSLLCIKIQKLKVLLEMGGDPNTPNAMGMTPLFHATGQNSEI